MSEKVEQYGVIKTKELYNCDNVDTNFPRRFTNGWAMAIKLWTKDIDYGS